MAETRAVWLRQGLYGRDRSCMAETRAVWLRQELYG